jgi:hypothetical protein
MTGNMRNPDPDFIPYANLLVGQARTWWLEAVRLALSTKEERQFEELTVWGAFERCCRKARIPKGSTAFNHLEEVLWEYIYTTTDLEISEVLNS